ncbi:MAG: DUF4974 domain-containing protein [Cyclobacteriaceae bacterium]|nr:DUF4974 domain-containing protein [Cyclobacteriaceae bacterium]
MNEESPYILISAFLSGEANADEINELRLWLAHSEQNRREFEGMKSVWESISIDHGSINLDALFVKSQKEIAQHEQRSFEGRKKIRRFKIPYLLKIAAAVSVVISSFIVIRELVSPFQASVQPTEVKTMIKENPAGIKTQIVLPDSSIVHLNSESQLRYTSNFGSANRELFLEGEAFFVVKKHNDLPFKVHSAGKIVEAHGTEFNVKALPNEQEIRIALVEGVVSVVNEQNKAGQDAMVVLKPGEMLYANLKSGKQSISSLNMDELLWRQGIIHFKNASMDEVVQELERWFGVKFLIKGNMTKDWNYTGEFANESLENILNSIGYSKKFYFDIDQTKVYVKPKD